MVYTTQLVQQTQLGASIKLDHEYTTATIMRPIQLPKNCPIIVQPKAQYLHVPNTTDQIQLKFYSQLSEQKKAALCRDTLANRLRENWQEKNDEVKSTPMNLDDSLTSLGWLHGMNIMKSVSSPTPPPSPTPDADVNPNSILTVINNVQPPKQTYTIHGTTVDYRANPYVKPPYSYATLICMAIKETGVEKITLSSIYQWITENFIYYRLADPSWQNSIRHNLSLNKCFQKVPRRKDEPGKGGFWRINPEYNDMLVDGVLKKRRNSMNTYYPPVKKIKTEPEDHWGKDKPDPIPPYHPEKQFVANEGVSLNDLRNGNFSWNQLLNQDIMVGGITIKTEDIIDARVTCLEEDQYQSDSSAFNKDIIGDMTPPSSGNSNSDNSLDEIFDFNADYNDSPLDLSASSMAIDLTLQGIGLKAPDWWESPLETRNGMHTPVHDDTLDDWTVSRLSVEESIEAFDIGNLFDTSP